MSIDKAFSQKLFEEIEANAAKLNGCNLHEFLPLKRDDVKQLFPRYRCANCGGEVDSQAAHWYNLGKKHTDK